jgi:hypothetical protein
LGVYHVYFESVGTTLADTEILRRTE